MKISIGFRLFFAVLISILSIATVSLFLMRAKVADSFSTYAVKIELDRLQGLYQHIQIKFAEHQNWKFIENTTANREGWLTQELRSLYQEQDKKQINAVEELPDNAQEKREPHVPQATTRIYHPENNRLPPLPPPSPPEPPAPPSPPEPPTRDLEPKIVASLSARTDANNNSVTSINANDLYQRISLLDASGKYLAGKQLDGAAQTARPIFMGTKIVGFLVVSHPNLPSDKMAQEFIDSQKNSIIFLMCIAVLLSAVAASVLARHFRRPIHQLVAGAEQLEKGNFQIRLTTTRGDELGRLAHSFNQLAQKLGEVEQQRRQWVADTSHELRTPISVMRAQLEAIQDGIRPSNSENLALLHRQIMSLNKLIDELYTLARADIGALDYHFEACDLTKLLTEINAIFEEKFTRAGLEQEFHTDGVSHIINGDLERLRQVFTNLFENSIRYTHSPGKIRIALTHDCSTNNHLRLTIEDSIPSVPEIALHQLGERFFRLESSRNRNSGGAGLGLALCRRIIEAHHGQLLFTQSDLGGLKVEILFDQERTK